jgi:phosphatidylglycerophosphatase A
MFALGKSKYAPGTVASFVTFLIFIFFYNIKINILVLITGVSLVFVYSVYSIDRFNKYFNEVDSSEIVIDEFVGQSIPILTIYKLLPSGKIDIFILYTLIGFFLFRIFDITKPYPANKIDKHMKNGFGVMLDDVVAGVYSSIVLIIIFLFISYE